MTAAATILFARHGSHAEVDAVLSGRSAIGLSTRGRAEAAALGRMLDGRGIDAVHASPRARTMETAAIVAERLGLTVSAEPALDEIDFGRFRGRAFAELDGDPAWRHWNAARGSARCPDGETMAEAVARAWAFVSSAAMDGATILCVSHCDVIRGIVADRIGLGCDRIFALECAPASLTTLVIAEGSTRLAGLNERPRYAAARSRATAAMTSVQSPVAA